MKKNTFLFICMFLIHQFISAQGTEQMIFQNDFREASGGLGNLTTMFMGDEWWNDVNGNPAAVIRVKVVGMSAAEMKKLDVKGSANLGIGKKLPYEKEFQWLIAVSAGNNMYLDMTHSTYGTSSRLSINQQLKPKTIYDVTLVNNETTTIVVRSQPNGADVYLDGDKKGVTPCEIPRQKLGHHTLKLLYGGNSLVQEIEVEEGHTVFDNFDFRERTKVDITSDPKGAAIYVDGTLIGKAPILGHNLILGAHTFKAELTTSQMDEKSVNITKQTTIVDMYPVKKGNVQITTKYSGRPVAADLVVDNEQSFSGKETYIITQPYGKHTYRVTSHGKTKEKTLNINKPEMHHVFKLSAKNDFEWPWKREYNQRVFGFSIGYVSKQVIAKYESLRYKFEPAYARENKSLSGIQMGVHVQPTLPWGLGIYSGLFYELYMSSCNDYGSDFQYFSEHSMNLPIHLYYRLAFAKNFSIAIHSGIGMDLGLYASYSNKFLGGAGSNSNDGYYTSEYANYYGESNGGPNSFNLSWDLAGAINMGPVAFNIFISKGLLNHKGFGEWDEGQGKNVINKFGISLSYLFGAEM